MPKVALLSIGINYIGQSGRLKGCINDSNNFTKLMKSRLKKQIVRCVQMNDVRSKRSRLYPTKRNIERELIYLRHLAKKRKIDRILFHYSGHGGQRRDRNREERDKKDETLYPVDYRRRGVIPDDYLIDHILNRLPKRVHFFGLIDACHSGTAMDLRYRYRLKGMKRKLENKGAKIGRRHVMISGCVDSKYSYDVRDKEYGNVGACTTAFIRAVGKKRRPRMGSTVKKMRKELRRKKIRQVPQISGSFFARYKTKIPVI
jgi:hypothetical protein